MSEYKATIMQHNRIITILKYNLAYGRITLEEYNQKFREEVARFLRYTHPDEEIDLDEYIKNVQEYGNEKWDMWFSQMAKN